MWACPVHVDTGQADAWAIVLCIRGANNYVIQSGVIISSQNSSLWPVGHTLGRRYDGSNWSEWRV